MGPAQNGPDHEVSNMPYTTVLLTDYFCIPHGSNKASSYLLEKEHVSHPQL